MNKIRGFVDYWIYLLFFKKNKKTFVLMEKDKM